MGYKSNSFADREQPEEKKKVRSAGTGHRRKRNVLSKMSNSLMLDEGTDLHSYVFNEMVKPNLLSLAYEIAEGLASMIFLKEKGRGAKRRPNGSVFRDYTKPSSSRSSSYRPKAAPSRSAGRYSYEIIAMDSRGEAELALDILQDELEMYGKISVLDYYDACGVDSNSYVDNNYGWLKMESAYVRRVSNNEYEVVMPDEIVQLSK